MGKHKRKRAPRPYAPPYEPSPEDIEAGQAEIQEEGFTDRNGKWHPPWNEADEWSKGGCHQHPHVKPIRSISGWEGDPTAIEEDPERTDRRRRRRKKEME